MDIRGIHRQMDEMCQRSPMMHAMINGACCRNGHSESDIQVISVRSIPDRSFIPSQRQAGMSPMMAAITSS